MSLTHLHLLTNHIPVLGTAFALLLLSLAILRKSNELMRVAFAAFLLLGLSVIPVYLTGEPAENLVKSIPGVAEAIIEQHEEAANISFIITLVLGGLALGGLLWFRRGRPVANWFAMVVLAASLVTSATMFWTANLGGQVRHAEIRSH